MLNNDSDTFPLRLNVMTSLYDLEKITYAFLYYLESENIFKNAQFDLKTNMYNFCKPQYLIEFLS